MSSKSIKADDKARRYPRSQQSNSNQRDRPAGRHRDQYRGYRSNSRRRWSNRLNAGRNDRRQRPITSERRQSEAGHNPRHTESRDRESTRRSSKSTGERRRSVSRSRRNHRERSTSASIRVDERQEDSTSNCQRSADPQSTSSMACNIQESGRARSPSFSFSCEVSSSGAVLLTSEKNLNVEVPSCSTPDTTQGLLLDLKVNAENHDQTESNFQENYVDSRENCIVDSSEINECDNRLESVVLESTEEQTLKSQYDYKSVSSTDVCDSSSTEISDSSTSSSSASSSSASSSSDIEFESNLSDSENSGPNLQDSDHYYTIHSPLHILSYKSIQHEKAESQPSLMPYSAQIESNRTRDYEEITANYANCNPIPVVISNRHDFESQQMTCDSNIAMPSTETVPVSPVNSSSQVLQIPGLDLISGTSAADCNNIMDTRDFNYLVHKLPALDYAKRRASALRIPSSTLASSVYGPVPTTMGQTPGVLYFIPVAQHNADNQCSNSGVMTTSPGTVAPTYVSPAYVNNDTLTRPATAVSTVNTPPPILPTYVPPAYVNNDTLTRPATAVSTVNTPPPTCSTYKGHNPLLSQYESDQSHVYLPHYSDTLPDQDLTKSSDVYKPFCLPPKERYLSPTKGYFTSPCSTSQNSSPSCHIASVNEHQSIPWQPHHQYNDVAAPLKSDVGIKTPPLKKTQSESSSSTPTLYDSSMKSDATNLNRDPRKSRQHSGLINKKMDPKSSNDANKSVTSLPKNAFGNAFDPCKKTQNEISFSSTLHDSSMKSATTLNRDPRKSQYSNPVKHTTQQNLKPSNDNLNKWDAMKCKNVQGSPVMFSKPGQDPRHVINAKSKIPRPQNKIVGISHQHGGSSVQTHYNHPEPQLFKAELLRKSDGLFYSAEHQKSETPASEHKDDTALDKSTHEARQNKDVSASIKQTSPIELLARHQAASSKKTAFKKVVKETSAIKKKGGPGCKNKKPESINPVVLPCPLNQHDVTRPNISKRPASLKHRIGVAYRDAEIISAVKNIKIPKLDTRKSKTSKTDFSSPKQNSVNRNKDISPEETNQNTSTDSKNINKSNTITSKTDTAVKPKGKADPDSKNDNKCTKIKSKSVTSVNPSKKSLISTINVAQGESTEVQEKQIAEARSSDTQINLTVAENLEIDAQVQPTIIQRTNKTESVPNKKEPKNSKTDKENQTENSKKDKTIKVPIVDNIHAESLTSNTRHRICKRKSVGKETLTVRAKKTKSCKKICKETETLPVSCEVDLLYPDKLIEELLLPTAHKTSENKPEIKLGKRKSVDVESRNAKKCKEINLLNDYKNKTLQELNTFLSTTDDPMSIEALSVTVVRAQKMLQQPGTQAIGMLELFRVLRITDFEYLQEVAIHCIKSMLA